jgi:hypothetical protein
VAFISGSSDTAEAIIKALLGEGGWRGARRVVLDITIGEVVKLHVERYADRDRVADAVKPCAILAATEGGMVVVDMPPVEG